jgi:pimeloyl-ACP methyl ester carboxylesterase
MKRFFKRLGLALLVLVVALLALGFRRDRPAAGLEAKYATAPSKFVELDGLRVHYRDRGAGPVVVLLHGSNASLFTWEGWTAALAKDHRVIALDLPGHGLTGPDPRERYQPAGMAEVVDLLVAKLGVARFTLAGNSMGGNVAWHYALAHPEKLEGLILVDAAGYPRERPLPLPLRIGASPIWGHVARWVTPRLFVARSLRDTYGDPSRVTEAGVDEYDDFLLRDGNRHATHLRLSRMSNDGLHARLKELKVPTLILWGAQDRWILPAHAARFHADIAGSQLVMFDGLGHIPMEEDPVATAAAARSFLAALKR